MERDSGTLKLAFESGYFICTNDVFDLPISAVEMVIYMALTRYAGSNNRAWPSYERLAADASCSTRRAKYAVKTLCECQLIAKEKRGNRTNLYLVYPPKNYCGDNKKNNDQKKKQGAENAPQVDDPISLYQNEGEISAPQEKLGVQTVHPEGANPAPSVCNPCTLSVQHLHPNINKNNNKNNNTHHDQTEMKEERGPNYKNNENENNEKDIEIIKNTFKAKKSSVKDDVIVDLLRNYEAREIQAAIKATDFDLARNPIAVIRSLLKKGDYLLPPEPEEAKPQAEEEKELPKIEEVRQYLSYAKDKINNVVAGA